jgi:hypothetical protein
METMTNIMKDYFQKKKIRCGRPTFIPLSNSYTTETAVAARDSFIVVYKWNRCIARLKRL